MHKLIEKVIRKIFRGIGLDLVEYRPFPIDFSEQAVRICNAVRPFTMTSPERINSLIEAVKYVVTNNIEGALVECGVWKGGSAMAMALTLKELGVESRDIYLYDTFSGMTTPTDVDVSILGSDAKIKFSDQKTSEDASNWCLSPLKEVISTIMSTGYPKDRLHFIEGKVEETIPAIMPEEIALLRLDTDWYESTKHELTYLFPRLKANGVIIIDDYGYWKGARKAVDEYFAAENHCILLNRIDYTGRIAIKSR